MYLAETTVRGRRRYVLRESYRQGDRFLSRDLFDLGGDPSAYIEYPGGCSFCFDDRLVQTLNRLGVAQADRDLEDVLFPFLAPEVRRIVVQMSRPSRPTRTRLSGAAMARAQEGLHVFDRRRLFYLRFGRMDSGAAIMRPHKFLNVLLNKSRDEIEHDLKRMERGLRTREIKLYVYLVLNLPRYFPGEYARLFPLGLAPDRLDDVFLTEICRLNDDPEYLGTPGRPDQLSEYLVRYAVMWFDHDFGQRPPRAQIFEEFVRSHSAYRPPPPAPAMGLARACRIFSLTHEEWTRMGRVELGRRYRRLALSCHPDQGGDPDRFIELNQAYQRLIDGK